MAKRVIKHCEPDKQKKIKVEKIVLKNYGESLTRAFEYKQGKFLGYFYVFKRVDLFGIILSVKYPNYEELEYIKNVEIDMQNFDNLRKFQKYLWHHFLQVKNPNTQGPLSEVNYFVVPISGQDIDFAFVNNISTFKGRNLADIKVQDRKGLIAVSTKTGAIWKYVGEVPEKVPEFFEVLYGKGYQNLKTISQEYQNEKVVDIILKSKLDSNSIAGFRKKCSGEITEKDIAFVKFVKSVKYEPSNPKDKNTYTKGTPMILLKNLSEFPFTSSQWDQGYFLISCLIDLEIYSLAIDLAEKINYTFDMKYMKQAITASDVDPIINYESLETLGDCVLKFLCTLDLSCCYAKDSESQLTAKRNNIVSNSYFSDICRKNEFYVYLKTHLPPHFAYRPAYFEERSSNYETLSYTQTITENVLADFFEGLVGCFYAGGGLLAAGEFLYKYGILKKWKAIKTYISGKSLKAITDEEAKNDKDPRTKVHEFYQSSYIKNSNICLSDELFYKFKDPSLLKISFTHYSMFLGFNYEKLEFIGDAILDLIVISSIYFLKQMKPHTLSSIKKLIVCNSNLASISLVSGLSQYIIIEDKKNEVSKKWSSLACDLDIIKDDIFNFDYPKFYSDTIESLIAAIFFDSKSLDLTYHLISTWLKPQILYAFHNIEEHIRLQNFRLSRNSLKVVRRNFTTKKLPDKI